MTVGRTDNIQHLGIFVDNAANAAEEVRRFITDNCMSDSEAFEIVKSIIEDSEVCVGVWCDESENLGVGTYIIKGRNRLRELAAGHIGDTVSIAIGYVPCICVEQAIAASNIWEAYQH